MKFIRMQKHSISINKEKKTVSKQGVLMCCYESGAVFKGGEFKNKENFEIEDEGYEDFFDEDS